MTTNKFFAINVARCIFVAWLILGIASLFAQQDGATIAPPPPLQEDGRQKKIEAVAHAIFRGDTAMTKAATVTESLQMHYDRQTRSRKTKKNLSFDGPTILGLAGACLIVLLCLRILKHLGLKRRHRRKFDYEVRLKIVMWDSQIRPLRTDCGKKITCLNRSTENDTQESKIAYH